MSSGALPTGPSRKRQAVGHALLSVSFLVVSVMLNRPEVIVLTSLGTTVWYPATGLALALMLAISPWYAPLVGVAAVVAGILFFNQPALTWGGTIGAVAYCAIYGGAAYVLRGPLPIDFGLRRQQDVIRYLSVTATAAFASAIVGTACLAADHSIPWAQYWQSGAVWLLGDEIGLLGVAPFLMIYVFPWVRGQLSGAREQRRTERRRFDWQAFDVRVCLESTGQVVSVLVVPWLVLASRFSRFEPYFLCLVPVVWIAIRHGIRSVVGALLVLNFGIVFELHYSSAVSGLLIKVCLLMLAVSATGLIAGSVVSERQRTVTDLAERTVELNLANQEMEKEIAERKRYEKELISAREGADAASRAKSEFLANMSHEIRTPLNGVIGMTELALDSQPEATQREYLETIKLSAQSLLRIVNDILDFSKIEAGKLDLDETDFNLRDCLEETLKPLALQADEKKIELLCDIAPDVPELVRGDANRLRQVVLNLLGNALKFTHNGEVVVSVEVEPPGNETQALHFIVADTGIGIPPEKQKFIFAPFTQADASTTRKYGGTGLGLTICARLVTMMGGRIWVESEVGKGSRFHFTAPLKSVAAPANAEVPVGEPALRGLKALIVDDNATSRKVLQGILDRWDLRTQPVEGAEQAVEELIAANAAGDPYRLILTDLRMPGIDGFALVEQVHTIPELTGMAIMMLSSSGYRGDVERCQELGISAYLVKPVRKDELLAAIQRVFAETQSRSHSTEPASSQPRWLGRRLHILLAEDNRVNQTVASRMMGKMGHSVVVANHGREALALLAQQTFDLVLMDVQMPEMDGLTATRNIREAEKHTGVHLPIIAMTAHAMKGDREHCLEAGVDGYVSKPVNAKTLMDCISALVGAGGSRDVRRGKQIQEGIVSGSQALWDSSRTLEKLGGDERLLHEVVDIFLVETPKKIASLRQALELGDADSVERTAHSLKGELGYLALPEISQKARELEQMGRKRDLQNAATLFSALQDELSAVLAAMRSAKGGDDERTAAAASGASS